MNRKKRTLLKMILTVIIIVMAFIALRLTNKPPEKEINEPNVTITPTKEPNPTIDSENLPLETSEPQIIEFTEKQKTAVEKAFSNFMDNAEYQTTLNEGDSTLEITFKDLGTVTFKLYEEYSSDSIDFIQQLIENKIDIQYDDKREGGRLGLGAAQFQFVTTERGFNKKLITTELFPMKYCLYHIGYSSNNFYFCTMNYYRNSIDNKNVPEEYINYLETYGGNMTYYNNNCIILGRAVNNMEILDNLPTNFQIESMTLTRNDNIYSTTFTIIEEPINRDEVDSEMTEYLPEIQ